MRVVDRKPVRRINADRAYSAEFWQRQHWLERDVLAARTDPRRQRIPRHAEIGLNGIHQVDRPGPSRWSRIEGTPWRHCIYIAIVVAGALAIVFISGRSIQLP